MPKGARGRQKIEEFKSVAWFYWRVDLMRCEWSIRYVCNYIILITTTTENY